MNDLYTVQGSGCGIIGIFTSKKAAYKAAIEYCKDNFTLYQGYSKFLKTFERLDFCQVGDGDVYTSIRLYEADYDVVQDKSRKI